MNCEECEDTEAQYACIQCGQNICGVCDKKIHNKGNRLLHIRELINKQEQETVTTLDIIPPSPLRKIDAHTLRHQQQQERFNSIQQQQKNNVGSQKLIQPPEEVKKPDKKSSAKKLNIEAPSLVLDEALLQSAISQDILIECPFRFKERFILIKIKYISQGIYNQTESQLRQKANVGDLMINAEEFKHIMKSKDICFKGSFKEFLEDLQLNNLINITIRKFGDSEPIKFVSLQVEELSFESLVWILKTIRKDEMTPTDKLIQSRIKECYGMKLPPTEWNYFLQSLLRISDTQGIINQIVRGKNIQIKITKCPIELLHNKQLESSNSNSSNTLECVHLITIENCIPWQMNDARQVNSDNRQIWRNFIYFLKEFFDNETSTSEFDIEKCTNLSTTSSNKQDFKWIRSVETGVSHNNISQGVNTSNQSFHSQPNNKKKIKKGVIKPPRSIQKAIPGGKYGCAQLLKLCGPLELRVCSLGMLCLLIQEAIQRGILIYYKTLLIKPNQNVAFDFLDYLNLFDEKQIQQTDAELKITIEMQRQVQEQQEKVHKVRTVVIELLQDQQRGVSLAKLPKLIQRRITFQFDLHELGFTKLKSFLQDIPEVVIENDGTTYASVILKNKQLPQKDKMEVHNELTQYNKKYQTTNPETNPSKGHPQRTLSNVQDYQGRADYYLQQILSQNQFGIPSQQLFTNLNQLLQTSFEFTLFGCNSFEEYLVKQAETYADVLIKAKGCIVYPKGMSSWTSWNQQQQQLYLQQQAMYQQQQYQQHYQQMMSFHPNNKYGQHSNNVMVHHQKSQSLTTGVQSHNQSLVKAESFIAGMQQHPQDPNQNQSLTFHSVSTTPINKEFFMIQEEESHLELDENLKFIEELLKESDDKDKKDNNKNLHQQNYKPMQAMMSLGVPWSPTNKLKFGKHTKTNTYIPFNQGQQQQTQKNQQTQLNSLHSWDFDNIVQQEKV